jgi:hypothetical protein
MFPKALNLYLGTSGAKPGDSPCSYTFLLIHLCRNVTVCFYLCFCRQLSRFCEEKLTKKIIFYCDYEALKVFRKYRCHPVKSPKEVRKQYKSGVFLLLLLNDGWEDPTNGSEFGPKNLRIRNTGTIDHF